MPASCQYVEHTDGIHEFIVLKNDLHSVEEWAVQQAAVYQKGKDSGSRVIRILMNNAQSGFMPIRPLMSRARELGVKYPDIPPLKTAIIVKADHVLVVFLPLIERLLRSTDQVKFFRPDQRETAIEWLRKE